MASWRHGVAFRLYGAHSRVRPIDNPYTGSRRWWWQKPTQGNWLWRR